MTRVSRPRRSLAAIATTGLLLFAAAAGLIWSGGAGLFTSTQASCAPVDGGPGVVTDKEDYQPGETVIITGCAMGAYEGQNLALSVTRPNGVVDSYTVTIASGGFTFNYQLNGITGDYTVKVMDGATLVASTTFSDSTSLVLLIDNDAAVTNDLPVTLNISWNPTGGDPTQARIVNVLNPALGCPLFSDPSWGPWMAITEDGTTNTDTFPHTLAAGPHALRKVCMQTAHGAVVGVPDVLTVLTDDDTIWYVVANPPLAESCGLDIVLVIDSSGSINATELAQMKTAMKAFVSAFLPETPTEIAIVEFDTTSAVTHAFSTNETSLNNQIDAAVAGGNTNWDDALFDARSLLPNRPTKPDLIVFASDGNPNVRGGHTDVGLGHAGAAVSVTEADAMDWATDESDDAKTDGTRILGIGIGSDLDATTMSAITGNVKSPPAPIDENVDLITTGFGTLATDLSTLAAALCGGITVHKVVDTDGNLGTTGDQITAGSAVDNWCYTPTSSGGTVTPANDCTDVTGTTDTFQISPSGNYTVSMAETVKPGYALVGAGCTGANNNGTFDNVDSVDGINLDTTDIVSCTFYNTELGSIEWEKRNEATLGHPLQGGASFTVGGASGPFACDGNLTNPVTVVDNGANDADPDPGQIKLNNVCPGSYTVTETVAPAGFALDDDPTRAVTVASGSLIQVIGTQAVDDDGNTDESDFHNRLGSISWEKRDETGSSPHPLQGGATFTVGGASGPFSCNGNITNPVTVVDNGANDADPDPGQIVVNNVCLGTYTVTETAAPAGYLVDDDPTRSVTVSNADLNAVIGTQATDEDGNTDESDFHNIPTGTIVIVKDTVPNGPQDFSFTENIPGCTVGPLDDDADGTLLNSVTCSNVNAATDPYTVTENPEPTHALTALNCDDANSTENLGTRTATINLEAGETVTCTFTNSLGSIEWEKRDEAGSPPHPLQGGATFTVGGASGPFSCSGDPTNPVTVVDNGANDADADPGQIRVNNVCLGSYTVTETAAPSGYLVDDDPTRAVTVSSGDLNAVIGTQGTDDEGNTDESDFHNIPTGTIVIVKDTVPNGPQDFSFTENIPGCTVGPLDDDADGTLLNSVTCSNVNAATDPYTVTENPEPTHALTALNCDDANSTENVGTRTATINLEPGETVTCTFTNTTTAQFVVNKDFQPNDPQNVTITLACTSGSVANDDTSASEADPANFTVTGFGSGTTCSASETPPPVGYTVNDSGCQNVPITPGGTASCTMINQLAGSITIIKDAVPNDPQDFDFACSSLGVFSLDDDADPTLSNTKNFPNVTPGTYTCTESNEPGWQISISCNDPDNGSTVAPPTATIDVDAGENVTCTFTNTFTPGPLAVGGIVGLLETSGAGSNDRSESSAIGSNLLPALFVIALSGMAFVAWSARRAARR